MLRSHSLWITGLLLLSSQALSQPVVADDRQWLQPREFTNYSWNDVNEICPSGPCDGTLPGSRYDLTGCTWASSGEVAGLMQAYIRQPSFGPAPDRYTELDSAWARAFQDDFDITWLDAGDTCVQGMTRDAHNGKVGYGALLCENQLINPDRAVLYEGSADSARQRSHSVGQWFVCPVDLDVPQNAVFELSLEEPVDGAVHSGIGNIRGWAIAEDGIERVVILIDDVKTMEIPFGGERQDVADAFPYPLQALRSGFSMAFGYSNLSPGPHTITAIAMSKSGETRTSSSTFTVASFHTPYIEPFEGPDLDAARVEVSVNANDEIELFDVAIDGRRYDMTLKWRAYSQRFEIIDIRQLSGSP